MSNFIDYGILIVGLVLSLILLFMICFRTPKVMRNYKAVLLCGWSADFIFNVCALFGRPLYLYHDSGMYMLTAMLTSISNNHLINYIGIYIWVYGFMLLTIISSLQFLARYLMVVWNIELKSYTLFLLLIVWNFGALSCATHMHFASSDALKYQEIARQYFDKELLMTESDDGSIVAKYVVALDFKTKGVISLFCYAFFQAFVTYGLNGYFGWKIYKKLQSAVVKTKTKYMQKQVNNILLIQALTPPLICGFPLTFAILMVIFKIDCSPFVVELFDRFLALVSISNPILAIYFVKPYRETVTKFFKSSTSQVSVSQAATSQTTGSSPFAVTDDKNESTLN